MRSKEAQEYRRLYKLAAWAKLRARKLAQSPLCERCKPRVVPATVVNHIVPHKGNRALFFSWSNLESVCKPCHDSTIQSEERLGYSKQIGVDGYPVDPRHPAYEAVPIRD